MKPIEIVELIKNENPDLLGKIPDAKAARIIRAALIQLGKQLDALDEGVVKVPGFGNFRALHVEQEKEGKKVITKRILFRVVKPKTKAE